MTRVVPGQRKRTKTAPGPASPGFTLVELMVTIAVAAILLMVALPALQEFVRNNRLVAMTNDFIADLALARAEAIRRGGRVTVCASDSALDCSGTNWATGRLVFADGGTAGTVDSGEVVLRTTAAAASGIALTSDSADHSQYLQYRPSGGTDASGTVSFKLCDSGGKGRTIVVALSGQVTTIGEEGTTCP